MNETIRAEKTPSRKQVSLGELVVLVLIIGVLAAILWPAVEEAKKHRNPKGPDGRMIPAELPDEHNRVTVKSGLSIVAPPNWDLEERFGGDNVIGLNARGSPLRRIRASIWVMLWDPPDEKLLAGAKKVTFQGCPAYEKIGYELDTFEYTTYLMYVERKDSWWRISIKLKKYLDELPEEFRPYLETIRFPEIERDPGEL